MIVSLTFIEVFDVVFILYSNIDSLRALPTPGTLYPSVGLAVAR